MIAQWMLGAIAFSLLCAVAALAAERGLTALRRPTRLAWAIALVVATTWPVIARVMLAAPAEPMTTGIAPAIVIGGTAGVAATTPWLSSLWLHRIDIALATLWIAASTLLLGQIVLALRTLKRVKRESQRIDIDGERVLVDDRLGPAVIGLVRPSIVIPAWLLGMDDALRGLVLRHEREHCRVRDPALVWLSVIATTVLPWNVALWWMSRRLRLAMEIDCDARTVRGEAERTRYAKLLLLIAQRKSSARFVPMLSDSQSQLGRRISAMHSEPMRHPALRAAISSGVVALAVTGACSSRMATNLTSPAPVASASAPGTTVESTTSPSTRTPPDPGDRMPATMLSSSVGPKYPEALSSAKVKGNVLAMYIVNSDGMVDTASLRVLESSNAAFTAAVREALPSMRYAPARMNGKAVRQLVQQNFLFDLSRGDGVSSINIPPGPPTRRAGSSAPTPQPPGQPYFDFQVEKPAVMRVGTLGPKYPQLLRDARVEGTVLAQFVVDTTGRVDMASLKVLKSDHDLFSDAVRAALADMQFDPALVGNRPVKQLLQQPFEFNLSGR